MLQKGYNNNATVKATSMVKNAMINKVEKTRSIQSKLKPIIQTRAMKTKSEDQSLPPELNKKKSIKRTKRKATVKQRTYAGAQKVTQQDFDLLNSIDTLSAIELADGDHALESDDNDGGAVNHDGVELSVNGSDEDEFPEADEADNLEPGEVSSSDDDENAEVVPTRQRPKVASKVVKVNSVTARNPVVSGTPGNGNKFAKFQHLRDDPDFKSFLSEMLDDKLKAKQPEVLPSGSGKPIKVSRGSTNNRSKGICNIGNDGDTNMIDTNCIIGQSKVNTPCGQGQSNVHTPCGQDRNRMQMQPIIKSPSDTTIYSPGLRKVNDDAMLIEKISNFVESICLDSKRSASSKRGTLMSSMLKNNNNTPTQDRRNVEERVQPSTVADQLLVQVEKFKARIEAPKGNYNNYKELLLPYDYDRLRSKFVKPDGLALLDSEILFLRNFDQDNEFFHITSQIEPGLRSKIERGEFIELERLLPKDKFSGGKNDDLNKQLFQLITQGTNSYMDPPQPRAGKINSIRKWNQAF